MRITLLLFVVLEIYSKVVSSDCPMGRDAAIEIVNVTTEVVVQEDNQTELSANLFFVYSWDIVNDEGTRLDGFLYKLEVLGSLETQEEFDYEYNYDERNGTVCDTETGSQLWTKSKNGSTVRCRMPCSDYFPNVPEACHELESVCDLRNSKGYEPLPMDARKVQIRATFGERYIFRLYAYQHWITIGLYDKEETPRFCKHELIQSKAFEVAQANYYCRNITTSTDPAVKSGPPSRFENYSISYDLVSNTAEVVFRWQEPYDVLTTAITRYAISVDEGESRNNFVTAAERYHDQFYYVTIGKIPLGAANAIRITPYDTDGEIGQKYVEYFMIKGIDACQSPYWYCDLNSDCRNLPSASETAAICNCTQGYTGNGVNVSYDGNGCTDYDACLVIDTCDRNAQCLDEPPPSLEAKCKCRPGFYGDGKTFGTGCRKISFIVLLTAIIPLVSITLITVYLSLKRIKKMKNGSKKLSKFLASNSVKYLSPLERSRAIGAFGGTYEISRDRVELEGVLGRGNFGIVYRGILNTESGSMQVAVKTTAEPHSREMEMEFLAEIAVIISLGDHNNVLGIIGCCTTGQAPAYLVTRFMKYGDLLHFLWDCREENNRTRDQIYIFKEGNIYDIANQVASGLEYVTGLRIIHGDIAARNVLVDEGLQCKISDFGLANDVYLYGVVKGSKEKRVPIRWISPERMQEGRVPITWRSDVWSFGILLYEMSTLGATPFTDIPVADLYKKLQDGFKMSKPVSCSPFLYDIMMRCWEWTPSKRPSFREIKNIMEHAGKSSEHHYENIIGGPEA